VKPRTSERTTAKPAEVADVKSTWCTGCPELPQLGHHITMLYPRPRPCNNQCPWLADNHGKTLTLWYDHEVPDIPMPREFTYAPWKRAQIWADDLRDGVPGYGSLCHVRLSGTHRRADDAWEVVGRQCTGALVMQQRELLRQVGLRESALSLRGAARVAGDMLGHEVTEQELCKLDLLELLAHAHPSLLDPRIGSDAVATSISEQEKREWGLQSEDWLLTRTQARDHSGTTAASGPMGAARSPASLAISNPDDV
jgi:hypothetical protein